MASKRPTVTIPRFEYEQLCRLKAENDARFETMASRTAEMVKARRDTSADRRTTDAMLLAELRAIHYTLAKITEAMGRPA